MILYVCSVCNYGVGTYYIVYFIEIFLPHEYGEKISWLYGGSGCPCGLDSVLDGWISLQSPMKCFVCVICILNWYFALTCSLLSSVMFYSFIYYWGIFALFEGDKRYYEMFSICTMAILCPFIRSQNSFLRKCADFVVYLVLEYNLNGSVTFQSKIPTNPCGWGHYYYFYAFYLFWNHFMYSE